MVQLYIDQYNAGQAPDTKPLETTHFADSVELESYKLDKNSQSYGTRHVY